MEAADENCSDVGRNDKKVFSGIGYGLIALLTVGVMEIHAATESTAVQQLARGEYLVRVGNCLGCHTAKDGQPFAGGLRLTTSFGTFVTPNITPDDETGIGRWSQEDFWRAMHEGKSRDGRLLYPAFPYTDYTKVTREDADLIFAYLQSIPAVSQSNPPHEIRFPYNYRPLLYVWRALFSSRVAMNRIAPKVKNGTGALI